MVQKIFTLDQLRRFMEVSGLNSFLGFRPKGRVCWTEEGVSMPSPRGGGGGGGIPGMKAQPGGGGGGGGGGGRTAAPGTSGGRGGAGGNEEEAVEDKAGRDCTEGKTTGMAPNCENRRQKKRRKEEKHASY